jgi:hypothetical protein
MARYLEALSRYRAGAFSCVEAAEFLGLSERHFRRLHHIPTGPTTTEEADI